MTSEEWKFWSQYLWRIDPWSGYDTELDLTYWTYAERDRYWDFKPYNYGDKMPISDSVKVES